MKWDATVTVDGLSITIRKLYNNYRDIPVSDDGSSVRIWEISISKVAFI